MTLKRGKFKIIPLINPESYYSVWEIVKNWLIPNLELNKRWHFAVYRLILSWMDWRPYPKTNVTTKNAIKVENLQVPWSTNAKWRIKWNELIKFLNLNNCLPK